MWCLRRFNAFELCTTKHILDGHLTSTCCTPSFLRRTSRRRESAWMLCSPLRPSLPSPSPCPRLRPLHTAKRTRSGFGLMTPAVPPSPSSAHYKTSSLTATTSPPGGGFVPHLSVGQASKATARAFMADVQREWRPITFEVDHVCLISRQGFEDPFTVKRKVSLTPS